MGALTKLDEFLSSQQIHTLFETVPGTFRNTNVENQGTNEDDSQSDPHPEAGIFRGQTTQNLGPKDCRDMLTGATEEIRNGHDLVTAVQKEIPYCSSGISSGKQKKARATRQPHFRSENTLATIGADQILLALQQLATSSNSANAITAVTESRNCLNPSRQPCPPSTGNQRILNSFKIYSKRF